MRIFRQIEKSLKASFIVLVERIFLFSISSWHFFRFDPEAMAKTIRQIKSQTVFMNEISWPKKKNNVFSRRV